MFAGQELKFIPDMKLMVGTEIPGKRPSAKAGINGVTLNVTIDVGAASKFSRLEDGGERWYFSPKIGDEGKYNLSLVVIMNLKEHPPLRTEFKFQVVVMNDAP